MTAFITGVLLPLGYNFGSLITLVTLLIAVLHWRRPTGVTGWALAVFLLCDSILIAINILIQITAILDPSTPALLFLASLDASLYGLTTLTAFLLIVAAANLLGQWLSILTRAGLVLWLLLQWPLWHGYFFTMPAPGLENIFYNTQEPVLWYTLGIILFYQTLSIALALRHRRSVSQPLLAESIALLQSGHLLVTVIMPLRLIFVPTIFSFPAALMLLSGLIRHNKQEQAAAS